MQNQQINSSQHQTTRIHAQAFAAKFKSKREVWRFATTEADIYLPSYETVTVFHIRDLLAGKRRLIKAS